MEPPLKYKQMTGFATTQGQMLEVNLAALLFLRGLNSGLEFQLGTNVKGAGALDDVVFRFKSSNKPNKWTTVYVQLKFKAIKPVQRVKLINPNGDFSLPKYFMSYLEIKQAMLTAAPKSLFDGNFETSVFVVFTNATASESLGQSRIGPLSEAEAFVQCGSDVFSFQDDDEILNSLDDCGVEGKTFLDRLCVFCGQPDATELKEQIEKELQRVDAITVQGIEFERIFDCFMRRIEVWWEKSNEVLHKGNNILQSSVLEIILQNTKRKYSLELDFEEAALEQLKDFDGQVFSIQSCESSCRLSLTKLCQAFGGQSLVLDCEGLLANQEALLVQWQKVDAKCLIVCTNDWSSSREVDYFSIVRDMLAIRDTTPILFLSNQIDGAVEALTNEFQDSARSYEDGFLFSQLTTGSREKVLVTKISFQGHLTTLSELLEKTPGSADQVLDAFSVMEIIDCDGSLTLGSALDEGIGFYVNRHLELANVVNASVLQDDVLRGTVIIRVVQSEALADPGFDNDSSRVSLGVSRVPYTNYENTFFEKVASFLASSIDSTDSRYVITGNLVSQLGKSEPVRAKSADNDNCNIFIGSKFWFSLFECNSVCLRFGQQDAVTALRVNTRKNSSEASFLFVSDETNENDLRTLSDFHKSKHVLTLADGQLGWSQSHEDIESIRRHIDEDQVSTFAPEKVTDVEDRLVLVCAEPGMGKSTLMARLAKNTKETLPHYFVFLTALNDHFQLFAQNKHKDAMGFLYSAHKIESHFHRSLLKHALEVSGNVVVLFDGYDEIAPKYVEQSCDLLSTLMKETKTSKIWMTSRNSIKFMLENKISKFSVKIRKFSKADQISFLKKFWGEKSNLNESELEHFIIQLTDKTSKAVREKEKDFMGIPLQTQMLAEVYEDHVTGLAEKTELPDKLDLLVLLEQFVGKKCRVHIATLKVLPNNPQYEELFETTMENFIYRHARLALVLILDDDITTNQQMRSIVKKSSKYMDDIQSGSYKTGFIDSIVNGKPRFVHRVFAEYFVAKWISGHFADNQELVKSKMFTADFVVVRIILDRILAKDHTLHTAVLNEDLQEVRTLLEHEDVDVHTKDGGGRTALHLAASLGTSADRKVNEVRGKILDLLVEKTSDFNQVDKVLGLSSLEYADGTGSLVAVDRFIPCTDHKEQFILTLENVTRIEVLKAVIRLDLPNLLGLWLDKELDAEDFSERNSRLLLLAFKLGSSKVSSLLLERNTDINKVDDQCNSVLHKASAYGRTEIVKTVINHYASKQGNASYRDSHTAQQQQLATFINMKNKQGYTALYIAALKGNTDTIGYLIDHGGDPRICTHDNTTPLHIVAELKFPDALEVILEALDDADRAEAINACEKNGDSVLIHAAYGGCVENVWLLVKAGGKLTQANHAGRTPLVEAAQEGHLGVVSCILSNFDENREGSNLHEYINMADKSGWTAIHIAAQKGHADVIALLANKGSDPQSRDFFNSTPLHVAAEFKKHDTLSVLLEALDEAERTDAVNSCNKKGNSVLMYGAREGSVECVELLVEAGANLTQANDAKRTPLMLAGFRGHQKVVKYLLNNFDADKEGMSLRDYINMADERGKSAIQFAAQKGRKEIVRLLIREGGDSRSRSHHDSTPLHLAAEFKHPDVVRILLEALDEVDRADAVNTCDKDGDSVLICGALGGCLECVELLVKAGAMSSVRNFHLRTPLMEVALKCNIGVVEYLLRTFDPDREGMNVQEYIAIKDEDDKSALDLIGTEFLDVFDDFL